VDFIRYYIGNISSHTFRVIQRDSGKFDDWKLIESSKFNHETSYGYEQILDFNPFSNQDKARIDSIIQRSSIIAENREPGIREPSLLWNNASDIADVLTLLSLARASYYPRLLVEKNIGHNYTLQWGIVTPEEAGRLDIVPFKNLGQFIAGAMDFIKQNPGWLKASGFIPSFYWYGQSQLARATAAPSILEMALYWISIEIVAGVYVETHGLRTKHKKHRVKRYIKDNGYVGSYWRFLNKVIDDWYSTRCSAFHEGQATIPNDVLKVRRQQVRDFTSLVLVEMLQPQEEKTKEEISTRMQRY
jgi:hypothetical protein